MRACASDSRTSDSSWRGVAVMTRREAPSRRMSTYAFIRSRAAASVSLGWISRRAIEMYPMSVACEMVGGARGRSSW